MTTPDAKLPKAMWLDKTRFEHRMKTDPDADKLRAALPEQIKDSLDRSERFEPVTPYLVCAITERLDMEKEAGRKWPFHASWHEAHECVKAAKEFVNTYNYTQTVDAHGEQLATTFDNNMYTAPEIFKPGFEFLTKTEQDVDKLRAALPEEVQNWLLLSSRVAPVTPDLIYAINVYLDMQKLAGKPCICATVKTAHECAKAARKLLDDYKRTVDALEEEDKTFKATIAALDEELATTKATIAARDEEIMTTKATIAARDEEIMTTKGKLAVCEGQVDTKDNLLKFAKLELAACKEQLKSKDDLLKSKDEQLKLSMKFVALKDELAKAKQAPKGQPLACVTNA